MLRWQARPENEDGQAQQSFPVEHRSSHPPLPRFTTELTTTTIVSKGISRTIRASESPQSGYILGSSGPARTDRCGCKVLLISRFQVRVLGGSLSFFPANDRKAPKAPDTLRGLCAATVQQPNLKYLIQGLDDVNVCVQRLRYGSVPQKFLHVFGMHIASE
jgi:hypothetical protein